jgi:rhodanese-related sulfurtransferase
MKRLLWPCFLLAIAVALAAEMPTIEPKDVAAQLQGSGAKPLVFHVGFGTLYRNKHIPGSTYTGQASKPEGLEGLKKAVAEVPHDRQIVLYCGCCPWEKCPNIRPAMELLKSMGFTNVKAMMVPTTFASDWIDKGYPIELGPAAAK